MHGKGNYKQGEKKSLRMGKYDSQWYKRQRTNFQNMQASHAVQYHKKEKPSQKVGKRPKQTYLKKKMYRWLINTWKDAQHCSLFSSVAQLCLTLWIFAYYYRNANQNYNEIPPHTSQKGCHQKTYNESWRRCNEKGSLLHCWWECKFKQTLWKTI